MENNQPFGFTVDKATKTVVITREFAADLSLVWDAFTKQELLDQWYAPSPFVSKTKFMDFSVGVRRFYAMVSPDGQERWATQRYTSISPKTNFGFYNVFTDKDENPEQYGSDWDLRFSEQDGITRVNITIVNESLERLETLMDGFRIGMSMTMAQLEKLLEMLAGK
jgi:uncharacterized protein YndB with AHSA1/START domain